MLSHTWTYQAMAHDILGMRLNRLTVPSDTPGDPQSKPKSYVIDEHDTFWAQHAGEPFPNVAAAVHEAIEDFKKRKADMTQSDNDPAADLTAGLATAFNAIPESLMEQKPGGGTDNYMYLDPKAAPGSEAPRIRTPFRRGIVFMVGGGNYAEMQSVSEWAQSHGRQVTYGATDLVSPTQFVDELCLLGRPNGGGSDLR